MQAEKTLHHQYDNGLTLVAQSMPWLASAAFSILLPAGSRYESDDRHGLANFTCEMVQRGCGEHDSRGFIDQLQMLGVDYSSSASNHHTRFGGAMKATELHETLDVYRDVLRSPHLPEDQLEDGRQVCFQEIMATEDELSRRAVRKLRERHFGNPDGRHADGTLESVAAIGQQDIVNFWERYYQPSGTIIAVAGKIDFEALRSHVGNLFGDWQSQPVPAVTSSGELRGSFHIPFDSEQTQIALAWPGVADTDPEFFKHRAAIGVLSDGMSSRLFYEVREKRGLCYSVYASAISIGDRGSVIAHSGTSAARAQETLDVLVEEIVKLKDGIRDDELARLKVQFRSTLIMGQESCRSRAGAIASDWHRLGRVRSLQEITDIITGLRAEEINDYLAAHPPQAFDLVTLGSSPLEFNQPVLIDA